MASTDVFDVGDSVTITINIKNTSDVLTDPSGGVTATSKDPSGNETALVVSNPSTGVYTAPVTIDESGTWYVRFVAAGDLVGAIEDYFTVRTSQFS